MNNIQKKKIMSVIIVAVLLIAMSISSVWADGQYDTADVGGGAKRKSSGQIVHTTGDGQWGYPSIIIDGKIRTGTRYIIRVKKDSEIYEDIGGEEFCDFFYLSHFYSNYSKSNEKNDKVDAKEILVSGTTRLRNTNLFGEVKEIDWHGRMNGYHILAKDVDHVFSTDASSQEDITKAFDGKSRFRHVISWMKMGEKSYTDNFGLSKDDEKVLLKYIAETAKYWKKRIDDGNCNDKSSTETKQFYNTCNDVINKVDEILKGERTFQVRAEILFYLFAPMNKLSGTNYLFGVDTSNYFPSKGEGEARAHFMTSREAISYDIKILHDGKGSNYMKTLEALWEDDIPWVNEKQYKEEVNYFLSLEKIKGDKEQEDRFSKYYWYGWDYINPDDPNQRIDPDIVVKYLEEETNKEVKNSTGANPGTNVTKADISEYTYIGVQLDDGSKKSETSIDVPDDNKPHTIIFWYKKTPKIPKVTVKWILLNNSTDNFSKGKVLKGPTTENLDINRTYTKDQVNELGNNYAYVGVSVDGGSKEQDTSVTVKNDGKDHEVIFAYVPIVSRIKVIGVCQQNKKTQFFKEEKDLLLEVNKTYKASDFEWKGYKLVEGKNVRIIKGTLAWTGEEADTEKGTAKVSVKASDYTDKVLVVFYYESIYKVNVRHVYVNPLEYDSTNKKKQTDLETFTMSITPDVKKTISSLNNKYQNYINLEYSMNPAETLTPNGFEKYSNKLYNVSFVPKEGDYYITFKYTSQIIEVRHEYADGTPVKPPVTKILNPDELEGPIPNKEAVYYKLNDGPKQKPDTIKVPIKSGVEKQTLVFVYPKPYLIFGDEDPNKDPYYPEDKTYEDMKKKYNVGIFPEKMNNQLIGQSDSKYYWVLDETGYLLIRLAYTHTQSGTSTCYASVKIPFDVQINGTLISANTPINLPISRAREDYDGYEVWEGSLQNIHVPIWTEEKEYTITVTVPYSYAGDDMHTESTGVGTAKVTVVGAVYDFSVTSIDGSNTTGDAIWKTSLFPSAKEYKANTLPIGQGIATQQNPKYGYGIKRGTRFYFSINTKGEKNGSIEITPKFYYYSNDGKIVGKEVKLKSGGKDITTFTRVTSLTDSNRTTTEYQQELAKGKEIYKTENPYANAKPNIFTNGKIIIGKALRTPYLNYGKGELKGKYHEQPLDAKGYKSASHWYGDYVIPNNVVAYNGETEMPKAGCIVVEFSIITRDKEGKEYLAYNYSTPFIRDYKESEWKYEDIANSFTLPRIGTVEGKKYNIDRNQYDGRGKEAYAPVIIYGPTGTQKNVDSTGTH